MGGTVIKSSFSNLPALKTPVDRHPMGCHTRCTRHSKILHFAPSEDQNFALNVSLTRFWIVWCQYHRDKFHLERTVIKSSFSNLPALKTPVDRHPIGCHTRCSRHCKILYFAPLEDQIFALNVSLTRFWIVWCQYHKDTFHLGRTVITYLSRICPP